MSRNQLDQETSPYLLQHRTNPVHWRPWGDEALAAARAADQPILLSVGYAACHWCHVMAHESFEDEATAKLINELFVPVKVDREERPDIDMIYQTALVLLGESGGWPLTMFLTPDAEPFWGGTYFPPTPRYGRPSFRDVLLAVSAAYRREPEKIATNVAALKKGLEQQARPAQGSLPSTDFLDRAARALLQAVDFTNGGLKGAPKFPQTSLFSFLWRAWRRSGDDKLRQAVILTLDKMSQGGIFDHLGGGFARYSTDETWTVPHFEKMLYDNAQLIELLTQVWQETRSPLYAQRVAEVIGWVARDMMAEHDAFAATVDADSEGVEGKYYVWTADEIDRLLPPELAFPFKQTYGVTAAGNWEGRTILTRHRPPGDPADPVEQQLDRARRSLLIERSRRVPPARDDKILGDWNGMMIAALANASLVFGKPEWLVLARHAFDGICRHLGRGDRLAHSLRHRSLQPDAMLDDYAQMTRAALILYSVSGQDRYLEQAKIWTALADKHYWDDDSGGYFFTADDAANLILRSKTASDQATPSGNGVMVEVLARLFHHTGDDRYRSRAEEVMAAFAGELQSTLPTMATMLNGWELLNDAVQVVIVGPADSKHRRNLIDVVAGLPLPTLLLAVVDAGQTFAPGHPAADKVAAAGNNTAAFVCHGPACSVPIGDGEALRAALAAG